MRCFVAVAEEGHFNKAAQRLGISQPPLTEHIRILEETLGCKLFERTTRSIRLTDQGRALLDHARHLLSEIERTREIVSEDNQSRVTVLKLGLLHAHTYTFLPSLLKAFFKQHPEYDVQLIEYSTGGQTDTILSPAVDAGLVREPLVHPEIEVQTLFTEPYLLAIPSDWRSPSTVDIAILNGRPIIGYPSHDDRRSTRSLFRDFLSQHQVRPSSWREVTTMHSALALVAANMGIAPVPNSQRTLRLPGVSYREIKQPPPELSVGLAWRRGIDNPLVNAFSHFARDHFGK
ncbi:MAG: LysR family transcriptional regulator [Burkholderiaceae bacterium]|nr:LysR family transcriptional regulator [Burkholderiaceae bacterium]